MYLHVHIPYNLAKRIIVFVSNHAKVMIRLDELTQFLKECQHPEDVITKSFFNVVHVTVLHSGGACMYQKSHQTRHVKDIMLQNFQNFSP